MGTITKQKPNKLKRALRVLVIIIGAFIAAYGLETVLIPNNVSDGGVTGLSIVGSTSIWIAIRTSNRDTKYSIYIC